MVVFFEKYSLFLSKLKITCHKAAVQTELQEKKPN